MATSGSYDFTVTGGQVIDLAYQTSGIYGLGQSISGTDFAHGRLMLNLLVKNMMGPNNKLYRGLKVWQRSTLTLTLTAKAAFSLKSTGGDLNTAIPVKVLSAILRDTDNNDTPLASFVTREDYDALPNKSETGTPVRYIYERKLTEGLLTLDSIPETLTDTVILTVLLPLQDIDNRADDLDFPQEWFLPLVRLLSVELSPTFGAEVHKAVGASADRAIENANTIEPEATNLYYEPKKDW